MIRVTFFIDRGEESESYVEQTFLPLLRELPELRRIEAARVLASATGEVRARFLIDLLFDDEARMNQAFASAEGRRISREIMNNAGSGIEMVTSESLAG
ncbi:MAG: EthD family reductase [Bacteroidetes bacterium]|nr:EthD family reductase [Bacteroidota bacterium]